MTLHTSKGLEYPVVFQMGMEEDLFPHRQSLGSDRALEEERRLCSVGMKRAREELVLSRAHRRQVFGMQQRNSISRFLLEIPADLIDVHPRSAAGAAGRADSGDFHNIDYGESQLRDGKIARSVQPVHGGTALEPGRHGEEHPAGLRGRIAHPTP